MKDASEISQNKDVAFVSKTRRVQNTEVHFLLEFIITAIHGW